MADRNALALVPADWLDAAEWAAAGDTKRRRYLQWVAERAAAMKRRQIAKGLGSDGKPLAKVKPSSRPDGADGRPLEPHYAASRSIKWLRTSIGVKGGTVTLHWSHGFGQILGYHARGEVIGAHIRDVIAFPRSYEDTLKADARHFWRGLGTLKTPGPKRTPPASPAANPLPFPLRRPAPYRVPAAARPAAMTLRPSGDAP